MRADLIPEPGISCKPGTRWFAALDGHPFLLGLVLIIAVVAVYFPVHVHPFFSPDDDVYVTNNAHTQAGLSWKMVSWALGSRDAYEWQPLIWVLHMANWQMFGKNPAWHHDINVVFHGLNAVLLFWVFRRATGFTGRSFMVAALFALHPINVEAVAWIAELKTLASTLFFLLALDAYRRYASELREARFWLVALLFALGLMCKPQVIMLPFVLLLWDYWPLHRMFSEQQESRSGRPEAIFAAKSFWWLIREKLPLFALAAADAWITARPLGVGHVGHWRYTYTLSSRMGMALVCYVRYIGKAFWPFGLAPHYPLPGNSLRAWEVLTALAVLLAITGLVAAKFRYRYLVVGWLWFLLTMAPMSGIIPMGPRAMADRFAYIAFVGLFIMLCWGVTDLLWSAGRLTRAEAVASGSRREASLREEPGKWAEQERPAAWLLPTVSAGVLLTLAVVAHHQVGYWRDDLTLWSHTVEVTTDNWVAENRLGSALYNQGKPEEALVHLQKALVLDPDNPDINLRIALCEHRQGDLPAAIGYYKRALSLAGDSDPEITLRAETNLGYAYRELGDTATADGYFAQAASASRQRP